jgi:hypothetical protein
MWMSQDATKGSVLGEPVGPRSTWHPFKSRDFIVSADTRSCLPKEYAQDGSILLSRVFQGFTGSSVFEDCIEQLLTHCGKWPEPKSVLVMDNASFHHLERVEQLCANAGVKLVYLPPYSPDLN